MRSKFIALQFTVPPRLGGSGVSRTDRVEFIARQWDRVIIVTASRQVWELIEMGIELKLDNLYRKHLYELAISLANSSNYDHGDIARIFCRYGDPLCAKGDFDNAITQYIRTIGHIEPSYVIRRFLDGPAQRIKNLTKVRVIARASDTPRPALLRSHSVLPARATRARSPLFASRLRVPRPVSSVCYLLFAHLLFCLPFSRRLSFGGSTWRSCTSPLRTRTTPRSC